MAVVVVTVGVGATPSRTEANGGVAVRLLCNRYFKDTKGKAGVSPPISLHERESAAPAQARFQAIWATELRNAHRDQRYVPRSCGALASPDNTAQSVARCDGDAAEGGAISPCGTR